MTFPSGTTISTTNLASGTANPASARSDLLSLVNAFNALVASEGQAMGVCVLSSAGTVETTQLPSQYETTGADLNLSPDTGLVKVNDILRLQLLPKATVLALPYPALGDIAVVADDLTGTNPKLAMYDGTAWKYQDISSWTALS